MAYRHSDSDHPDRLASRRAARMMTWKSSKVSTMSFLDDSSRDMATRKITPSAKLIRG
jgi:hypothetical protein